MSGYILGIDTSNYTTSVAITDEDENVLADERKLLPVKKGERGLRQQEALFRHLQALPGLLEKAFGKPELKDGGTDRLKAVAVSTRPRPVEGSYMPCFLAGESTASSVAAVKGIPLYRFSHQEGHIAAVTERGMGEFLCWHLSGGTCELLRVRDLFPASSSGGAGVKTGHDAGYDAGYDIEIIGKTRDISFGQLLDRVGVKAGIDFPAGSRLDRLAYAGRPVGIISPVKPDGLEFNVSGMETQALRAVEAAGGDAASLADLSAELFERISGVLTVITRRAKETTGIKKTVFCGGVADSSYIQQRLKESLEDIVFGEPSSDNAVGTAKLGARASCRENL